MACSPAQDETKTTSETVYRLPWPDASGEYSLQDVSLPTFLDPDKLRGNAAEIIVNPRVDGHTIVGEEPIGRWVRSGARLIPADAVTLQAATIYAHIEKLSEIDRATGVGKFVPGRERVGVQSLITDGAGAPAILNNAVYDGRLDSLFVVPYSPPVGLNISLNAGIIGHEHFHRVFQAIVLNPIREAALNGAVPYGWDDSIACAGASADTAPAVAAQERGETQGAAQAFGDQIVSMKVFNQVLVRGVNEGFADFWGWAYSRDESFVGRSLGPVENSVRRLDVKPQMLPQKVSLRNLLIGVDAHGFPTLKSEAGRVGAAYRFGTEYARVLRGIVDTMVDDAGLDRDTAIALVRSALAASLSDISTVVLETWGRDELDAEMMLKPVFSKLLKAGESNFGSKTSSALCGELVRMSASASFKTGLCDGRASLSSGQGLQR